MHSSMEEALSIFRKWEEEKSSIRVIMKLFSVGGLFQGSVFKVDSDGLTILLRGAEDPLSGCLSISLVLARSITFIDPRDGPTEEDRVVLAREMSFGVGVVFSSGERLELYAVPE